MKTISFFLAATLMAPVFPASAEPVRQEDPVEAAGMSLSRFLAAQRTDQKERMRLQSIELARIQQMAFSTALQTVLGQGSLDWLGNRSNPSATGIQPIPGREGLLVSYAVPPGDSLAFLTGRSFTYDDAVGAVALVLQERTDSARTVLSALQRLLAPNGTIGFSYGVDSSWADGRVRTGTLAWVGYAMALYQRLTGDRTYQASAEAIAGHLKRIIRL